MGCLLVKLNIDKILCQITLIKQNVLSKMITFSCLEKNMILKENLILKKEWIPKVNILEEFLNIVILMIITKVWLILIKHK